MNYCIVSAGSVTRAMKAQAKLASGNIQSEIVKLDANTTRQGCAYGLKFKCGEKQAVRRLLGSDSDIFPVPVQGG